MFILYFYLRNIVSFELCWCVWFEKTLAKHQISFVETFVQQMSGLNRDYIYTFCTSMLLKHSLELLLISHKTRHHYFPHHCHQTPGSVFGSDSVKLSQTHSLQSSSALGVSLTKCIKITHWLLKLQNKKSISSFELKALNSSTKSHSGLG